MNKKVDVSDVARTAINNFTDKSVENFISLLILGFEDALKSFKPKKEYDYATPELINKYKDEWKDFVKYLKEYLVLIEDEKEEEKNNKKKMKKKMKNFDQTFLMYNSY